MSRFVTIIIVIPLAIVLVALAVANRAPVAFTLDPFNPGSAGLTWSLPLFVHLLIALLTGVVVGSFATWWRQGRYRRLARERGSEVQSLLAARRPPAAPLAKPEP